MIELWQTIMNHVSSFRKNLLQWYHKNKRDLPWRKTKDPYAIWLSEIMLQQTTVATVIPYYQKFLKKFPTLSHLAKAPEQDYLKMWAGLGYYNRIRNFQKACQIVATDLKGVIPQRKEELLKLPGLGEYTAGAVASIAFEEPVPIVDGNIIRVLSRLYRYGQDITQLKSKKFFWDKAGELLDQKSPGDFNQAMMELGATVCTPKNPLCLLCPVKEECKAVSQGDPEKYPVRLKKPIYQKEQRTCYVYLHEKKTLLRQRQPGEILAGLWEFPEQPLIDPKSWQERKALSPIRHAIMNSRITISPLIVSVSKPTNPSQDFKWVHWNLLAKHPLTTITSKIIKKADSLL